MESPSCCYCCEFSKYYLSFSGLSEFATFLAILLVPPTDVYESLVPLTYVWPLGASLGDYLFFYEGKICMGVGSFVILGPV